MVIKLIDLESLEEKTESVENFLKDIGILYGHSTYVEVYDKNLTLSKILYHQECILDECKFNNNFVAKGNFIISKTSWEWLFKNLMHKKIILMSYEDVTVRERYIERMLKDL